MWSIILYSLGVCGCRGVKLMAGGQDPEYDQIEIVSPWDTDDVVSVPVDTSAFLDGLEELGIVPASSPLAVDDEHIMVQVDRINRAFDGNLDERADAVLEVFDNDTVEVSNLAGKRQTKITFNIFEKEIE